MSNQEVRTPAGFLAVVDQRFGCIDIDLAANGANHVVPRYLGPGSYLAEDALADGCWSRFNQGGLAWLNPPFADVKPWAMKAREAARAGMKVAMLVPAAVCTDWFLQYVRPHAYVFLLTPRVFVREVRDTALCLFTLDGFVGMDVWKWKGTPVGGR